MTKHVRRHLTFDMICKKTFDLACKKTFDMTCKKTFDMACKKTFDMACKKTYSYMTNDIMTKVLTVLTQYMKGHIDESNDLIYERSLKDLQTNIIRLCYSLYCMTK